MNREKPSIRMPLHLPAQDIEARQHIDALRESEQQFRALADNMSQLAWTADPRGQVNWYNQRWYSYTGASFEAMKALGWRSVLHIEHRERVVADRKSACRERVSRLV